MINLPEFISRQCPYPRHEIGLDWGTMHYLDTGGEGRTVLLVHGNPTSSFLYRKVIGELQDSGFRLIAPDLIGLGLSTKPKNWREHSLRRHGEALQQFVQRLDLNDIILVGQDWGGPIGAWMAAHEPDRVTGALFMNTAVLLPRRFKTTVFHRFAHTPFLSDLVFKGLNFPVGVMNLVQGDKRSIDRDAMKAYKWMLRGIGDRAAPLAMARMVPNRPDHPSVSELEKTDAWLRNFTGKIELVWGMRDPILGGVLKRMREAVPRATVTQTEAGHFLQEEVPHTIADAIRRLAT